MTESELTISSQVNEKVLSGLRILMSGRKLPHHVLGMVGMCETTENYMTLYAKYPQEEDRVYSPQLSVDLLFKWLSEIDDETILTESMNIALTDFNKKKR